MSRIFDIALGTTVLVVSISLIGWVFFKMVKRSHDPAKMLAKWSFTIPFVIGCIWLASKLGPFGPFLIVFMAIILSFMWTPHIGEMLINPLTNALDGGGEPPEPKPLYSIAITKRKLDKPLEAILAVREQLAKFPNDYEGTILLASIQAEDTKDLPGTEITLNHFCDSEYAPPKQVAAALTQLADWHLKIAQDADSAHATLQRIVEKFPDTEMALAAKQRIAHLGGAEKILLAAHDRQAMALPEGIRSAGLRDSIRNLIPAETNPAELANTYVKHLEQHPHDTEAREKLAVVYAEHYKRPDMAAIELEQMIAEPNHPAKQHARWLNLLADLQVRGGADYETVKQTLERILEKFPKSPAFELAQSRLSRLKLEIKGQQQKTPDVKLGVYEQNIGLKYGPTYGQPR